MSTRANPNPNPSPKFNHREHARELGVVDQAVAVVVGEVDEGLDGLVLDVGHVELDEQPLDLRALQVARPVGVDELEGVRDARVLLREL